MLQRTVTVNSFKKNNNKNKQNLLNCVSKALISKHTSCSRIYIARIVTVVGSCLATTSIDTLEIPEVEIWSGFAFFLHYVGYFLPKFLIIKAPSNIVTLRKLFISETNCLHPTEQSSTLQAKCQVTATHTAHRSPAGDCQHTPQHLPWAACVLLWLSHICTQGFFSAQKPL